MTDTPSPVAAEADRLEDPADVKDAATGMTPREAAEKVCMVCRVHFRAIAKLVDAMLANAYTAGNFTAGIPHEVEAVTLANWHASRSTRMAEQLAKAADALRELRDVQNGPPLPSYEKDWNAAIVKADAILAELEHA